MIVLALLAALGAAPHASPADAATTAAACGALVGDGDFAPCPDGRGMTVADLGWRSMECDCSHRMSDDWAERWARFRREPTIDEVRQGSPLRDGDVLVAVDGVAITSDAGGRRYAQIRPGQRVALTVRRDGRTQVVNVTAGARCIPAPVAPVAPAPPAPPSPAASPTPPAPPRAWRGQHPTPPAPPAPPSHAAPPAPPAAPTPAAPPAPPAPASAPAPPAPPAPPVPPTPPVVLPTGWFGFGINCDDCGWAGSVPGQRPVWRFRNAPRVMSVETGSPAARAGMRRGDLLTHIDGVALTSTDGGRRFGAVRPGQTVRWTYRRGSRSFDATTRAARRPDAATPAPPRVEAQRLRYAGTVGGASVEVRGAPVNVTRDDRTGETVIRSGDITVRIRPDSAQRRRQ